MRGNLRGLRVSLGVGGARKVSWGSWGSRGVRGVLRGSCETPPPTVGVRGRPLGSSGGSGTGPNHAPRVLDLPVAEGLRAPAPSSPARTPGEESRIAQHNHVKRCDFGHSEDSGQAHSARPHLGLPTHAPGGGRGPCAWTPAGRTSTRGGPSPARPLPRSRPHEQPERGPRNAAHVEIIYELITCLYKRVVS